MDSLVELFSHMVIDSQLELAGLNAGFRRYGQIWQIVNVDRFGLTIFLYFSLLT